MKKLFFIHGIIVVEFYSNFTTMVEKRSFCDGIVLFFYNRYNIYSEAYGALFYLLFFTS